MTRSDNYARRLVDQLEDHYLSWREESGALDAAYARWACAVSEDRAAAHAAYHAQLELEEHAARCYQRLVEAIPSMTAELVAAP